jgi:hypothetical protein
MRLICGLCHDLKFGDTVPGLFAQTIRDHLALHRRAGEDPVTRLISASFFVIVKRGEPKGYLQIVEVQYRLEVDFEKPGMPTIRQAG